MPTLINDIRQFFAHSVLKRYDRLVDADVNFTFSNADVYQSTFTEAFSRINTIGIAESDSDLLLYAQVFERYLRDPIPGINNITAGLLSASLYWLAGYSANSLVISNVILSSNQELSNPAKTILGLFSRQTLNTLNMQQSSVTDTLFDFVKTGNIKALSATIDQAKEHRDQALHYGLADDYIAYYLLVLVLGRLNHTSFWSVIHNYASAPIEAWQEYIRVQTELGIIPLDLWPSQQLAARHGLLDGRSSFAIRTPTSSGKTKMTELAFVNDLASDNEAKCLYLAPFKALVSEVENDLGVILSELQYPVASLFGGSEANEIEIALNEKARVVIATPEKMAAVLKVSGKNLSEFKTIVIDEGHLLDSGSRGAAFELQLASLRPDLANISRVIFLSAVLPNTNDIAGWLSGSPDSLAENTWHPASLRIGIVTWPEKSTARLTYIKQQGQVLTDRFFVPRILEEERWSEPNSLTGRMNSYTFPKRKDGGSIAAALSFKAAKSGPVIIFVCRPDWANSVARKLIERLRLTRPIDTNLIDSDNREKLEELYRYLCQILGQDSLLAEAVRYGFAIHHSGIPHSVRLVIEDEYRKQTLRLLIATNTIAQGVNFPSRTVIVHSFPRTTSPVRDFWNLAGRAGRAMKETEGEILILSTGKLKHRTLMNFLNRENMEAADSRILWVVREILKLYPLVDQKTINAIMENEDVGESTREIISILDAKLLEIMAEDLSLQDEDPSFTEFTQNLFAIYQASVTDLQQGSHEEEKVYDFLNTRRQAVLEKVPEGKHRKRYAVTNLSIDSSITLDMAIDSLIPTLKDLWQLDEISLKTIIDPLVQTEELAGEDPFQMSKLGIIWIRTGSYTDVNVADSENENNLDKTVGYVENVLSYRLPWVLTGLNRLLETHESELDPLSNQPFWFSYLPDYLRYGVNTPELTWVMSIGVRERKLAEWLIDRFNRSTDRPPADLHDFVRWLLDNSIEILEMTRIEWPPYFLNKLERVIRRYDRLIEILKD